MTDFNRRQVLKLLAAAPWLPQVAAITQAQPHADALGKVLPTRPLGATGESVTTLCVGGSHVGFMEEADVPGFIDRSIELGVRFFDTAEMYQRGGSERLFGQFLTPKYRDHIYLMTKTQARDGDTARRHLDESRQRMGVDVIDLWQVHSIEDGQDVERRFQGGVIDAFLEAREKGTVRHIGFTGHSSPAAHVLFLKRLKAMGVEFDASQMPINVVDTQYLSFIREVMPILVERDYGILAMKSLAFGRFFGRNTGWGLKSDSPTKIIPDLIKLEEALSFVWSQPVSSLVSGMEDIAELEQNASLARTFKPPSKNALAKVTAAVGGAGGFDMEFYKDG